MGLFRIIHTHDAPEYRSFCTSPPFLCKNVLLLTHTTDRALDPSLVC